MDEKHISHEAEIPYAGKVPLTPNVRPVDMIFFVPMWSV